MANPHGFTRVQFQQRLASFHAHAKQEVGELIAHSIERNKVQPFTIISGESIILIKFSPFGGVTLYGEEGRAMQALVTWLRQEHPSYRDYSGSPLNYPIKQQFVRQSLPFKN